MFYFCCMHHAYLLFFTFTKFQFSLSSFQLRFESFSQLKKLEVINGQKYRVIGEVLCVLDQVVGEVLVGEEAGNSGPCPSWLCCRACIIYIYAVYSSTHNAAICPKIIFFCILYSLFDIAPAIYCQLMQLLNQADTCTLAF